MIERGRKWGFNSAGAFGAGDEDVRRQANFPHAAMLPLSVWEGIPELPGTHGAFDPFDPRLRKHCDESFAQKIAPRANDPLVIGSATSSTTSRSTKTSREPFRPWRGSTPASGGSPGCGRRSARRSRRSTTTPTISTRSSSIASTRGRATGLEASFKLCWDDTNLYLLAHVADSTPMRNAYRGDTIWSGDGIELFVGYEQVGEPGPLLFTDRQILLSAGRADSGYQWHFVRATAQPDCAMVVLPDVDGKGYTLETSLPFAAFGFTPREGLEILFDLAVDDSADGNSMSQHSTEGLVLVTAFQDNSQIRQSSDPFGQFCRNETDDPTQWGCN
jgi:hypothetical protein